MQGGHLAGAGVKVRCHGIRARGGEEGRDRSGGHHCGEPEFIWVWMREVSPQRGSRPESGPGKVRMGLPAQPVWGLEHGPRRDSMQGSSPRLGGCPEDVPSWGWHGVGC